MKYRESQEMYLETILLLTKKKSSVYSVDIANELEYSRASVSRAVGLLQKAEFITISPQGEIKLTKKGLTHSTEIYERHKIITEVFVKMGAEKSVAEENACRVEHVISQELMQTLKEFNEKN